jgi:ubiquinone/menaquinone biosynthesis C-methylase UbiE
VSDWADPAPTYDRVAPAYARAFLHELDDKPFDRELLHRVAAATTQEPGPARPVCDLGCGPGHVGAFLAEQGIDVIGIDLSAGMVEEARRHYPALRFSQGDMSSLTLPDGALSGIVCFYALIHIPRAKVPTVLGEMSRVLAPGGSLLLAVHGGQGALHADQMAGQPADLDVTLFTLPELSELTAQAGFVVVETHERPPYPREHPTPRLYVWAQRPA